MDLHQNVLKHSYIYITLLFLLILSSCGPSKEQILKKQNWELEQLALEVMEVHDRSMKNHGGLFKLKKYIISIDECSTDSITKDKAIVLINNIEKADKDMMDWMHQYTAPDEFLSFDEKKIYYLDQKKSIEAVEIFMNKTIEEAEKFISYNPVKEKC